MIELVDGRPEAVIGTLDGSQRSRSGTAYIGDASMGRCQIWFDGPDEAYLVAAAIHRYLQADVVSDLILIPTSRGPALELPASAVSLRLVRSLVRRFGGHVEPVPLSTLEAPVVPDTAAKGDRLA